MSSYYPQPEPVFAALWALVANQPDFAFRSRKWLHWSMVAPDQQPALFQVQSPENTMAFNWTPAGIPLITFKAEFVIYHRTEETIADPATPHLNDLVGKVLALLEPEYKESVPRKPLRDKDGNQVGWNVRVSGSVNIIEGVGGDNAQSVAYIPVEILRAI